jgi:hypothetical protein
MGPEVLCHKCHHKTKIEKRDKKLKKVLKKIYMEKITVNNILQEINKVFDQYIKNCPKCKKLFKGPKCKCCTRKNKIKSLF